MRRKSKKTPRDPRYYPTSVRIPLALKERLDVACARHAARRAHLIVKVLEQWCTYDEKIARLHTQQMKAAL